MKKYKQTTEAIEFIKENYEKLPVKVLAFRLGINTTTLKEWCDDLGIRHDRKKIPVKGEPPPPPPKRWRPPAVYSNPNREQHIERILKTSL